MKKKITFSEFIVYLIIITGITFCIVDATFMVASIKYNIYLVLILIFLSLLYYYFLYTVKYSFLSIFLFFIIPRPLYLLNTIYKLVYESKDFIYSLIENQYIIEGYAGYFQSVIYFVLPIFVLFIFYVVVIKKWTMIMFILGGSIFITYYFISPVDIVSKSSLFILLCLVLISYNEYIKSKYRWIDLKVNIKPNHYFKIFIIVAVIMFLVNFIVKLLPNGADAHSVEWFEMNIFEKFNNIRNEIGINSTSNITKKRFVFSQTGFQQNPKKLGGPIKIDNTLAMKIYLESDKNEIHLRGTVKDYYNGYMWNKTNSVFKKYTSPMNEGTKKKIDIYPIKTITTTAFNLLNSKYVNNKWNYFYIDSDGEIYNPKAVNNGEVYTVYFDEFENIQAAPDSINYPNSYDKALEKYLMLPDNIPKRVYELAYEKTKEYSSPFYKAIALNNFLKENYSYDINVSYIPPKRDFVDYFLFDEKKGYCTYFASALAVMCRIVNIPTRYIEGFDVTAKNGFNGYTDVLNSNAHAWVEIYFDKIGWVTFDPTPGHTSVEELIEKNDVIKKNTQENLEREKTKNNETNIINNKIRNEIEKETESDSKKNKRNYYIFSTILNFAFLISVALYIKKNNIYKTEKKQIIDLSMQIIKFGKYVGVNYNTGETFREYSQRFGNRINISMEEYVNLYEKLIYGNNVLSDDDLILLITLFKSIKKCVKNNVGIIRFYIKDYLNMYMPLRK
ncbi:Transglutaminase-like superfamily protein [Caloramator quimbayensis]|uniref:Transglutaminase-like superfamily protein n=1 Tax=Caloramator quimbayensis TaxID=1147123 RepID=A0A1T4XVA1_9CLOT|nr:transglutaminase-like domain-containing protein [Caloramator quimbayensis]SKA93434.1 Transglutaminase-like superfamily protein [Caloramator quimbayensis]